MLVDLQGVNLMIVLYPAHPEAVWNWYKEQVSFVHSTFKHFTKYGTVKGYVDVLICRVGFLFWHTVYDQVNMLKNVRFQILTTVNKNEQILN